jgi:hypothetical protein
MNTGNSYIYIYIYDKSGNISYRQKINAENVISVWQKYNEYWKSDICMTKVVTYLTDTVVPRYTTFVWIMTRVLGLVWVKMSHNKQKQNSLDRFLVKVMHRSRLARTNRRPAPPVFTLQYWASIQPTNVHGGEDGRWRWLVLAQRVVFACPEMYVGVQAAADG